MNRAEKFLQEIHKVCLKHNLCISHEDCHGAFEIEEYNIETMNWLMGAGDWGVKRETLADAQNNNVNMGENDG